METSRKIIQLTETTVIDEYGEIKEKSVANVYKVPTEPDYVKIYIKDILYFMDMPRGLNPILHGLLMYMNWDNTLVINAAIKRKMSAELELKVNTIEKAITQFVKADLLIRKDTGYYIFNPVYFGRGKWENIYKLRCEINYDRNGRTFSTAIEKEEK